MRDGVADRIEGEFERYTGGAIFLHWVIGTLIIVNLAIGLGHDLLPASSRGVVMGAHKALGIAVLFLSIARLAWRLAHRPPALPPAMRKWEIGISHLLHWTFYVLMVFIPLSGWWMSSAGETRRPLNFFGLFDIPYLPVARGAEGLGGFFHEAHEITGLLLIPLLLLHVAAALKHHYIGGEAVLARMVPGMRPRSRY
jgi:cytochrome b561